MPQPYFVPVNPKCSLITYNNGTSGLTSTSYFFPFTSREIIGYLLSTRSPRPAEAPLGSVLLKVSKIFYEWTTDRVNGVNSVFGTVLDCISWVSYLYPPVHPSLPLKGEGEGGGDVILFNAFVLVNLRFY
jgi:hypothetical protein